MGEELLSHFREERRESAELLGDTPPPSGVDEVKVEEIMHTLRTLQKQGWLKVDRSTRSWAEFRRRQRERRAADEVAQHAARQQAAIRSPGRRGAATASTERRRRRDSTAGGAASSSSSSSSQSYSTILYRPARASTRDAAAPTSY